MATLAVDWIAYSLHTGGHTHRRQGLVRPPKGLCRVPLILGVKRLLRVLGIGPTGLSFAVPNRLIDSIGNSTQHPRGSFSTRGLALPCPTSLRFSSTGLKFHFSWPFGNTFQSYNSPTFRVVQSSPERCSCPMNSLVICTC